MEYTKEYNLFVISFVRILLKKLIRTSFNSNVGFKT